MEALSPSLVVFLSRNHISQYSESFGVFFTFRTKSNGFIGAIGVSGGTVEDDLKIAKAAQQALANL